MQKALMLVLAGVAIGLLVAPDKGTVTQRKVTAWLGGKAEDAEDAIDKATDGVRAKAGALNNEVKETKDEAQQEVKSWT